MDRDLSLIFAAEAACWDKINKFNAVLGILRGFCKPYLTLSKFG
jgi:hypothetical protein